MVSGTVNITSPTGINVEKAGRLVDLAVNYKCKIEYSKGSFIANAKSVLSILASQVMVGDTLEFMCDGEDEETALKDILDFFA